MIHYLWFIIYDSLFIIYIVFMIHYLWFIIYDSLFII